MESGNQWVQPATAEPSREALVWWVRGGASSRANRPQFAEGTCEVISPDFPSTQFAPVYLLVQLPVQTELVVQVYTVLGNFMSLKLYSTSSKAAITAIRAMSVCTANSKRADSVRILPHRWHFWLEHM